MASPCKVTSLCTTKTFSVTSRREFDGTVVDVGGTIPIASSLSDSTSLLKTTSSVTSQIEFDGNVAVDEAISIAVDETISVLPQTQYSRGVS